MEHLTPGQRALLQTDLEKRQRELTARLDEHHGGLSQVEHAREVLQQDSEDAPQRDGERELDMALSNLESNELRRIGAALQRLQRGVSNQAEGSADTGLFGMCSACAGEIPFDRLKAEPWAARCVSCQAALEEGAARVG